MNLKVAKKLIEAAEQNQIEESFFDNRSIQSDADVDKAVKDWSDQKKQIETQISKQAESDIDAWSKKDVQP